MVVYGDMYEDRDIAITHLFLDCQDGKLDGILLDDIEDELIKMMPCMIWKIILHRVK